MRVSSSSIVCGIALVSSLVVGCGGGMIPLAPASGAMITQTQDPAAIRAALARALAAESYTVEGEQLGQIVARLDHRGVQLRIGVQYSPSDYRISYISSTGLNFRLDERTGQPMISRHYARYVQRLENQIRAELDRPAREAQESMEAAREHQLEVEQARTDRAVAVERERHAAADRQRQAQVDQERYRYAAAQAQADRARAEADAEYVRRLPPPVIVGQAQATYVAQLAFQPDQVRTTAFGIVPGFQPDPYMLSGQTSGRVPSARLGIPESCPGFWRTQPDHVVHMPNGFGYLRIDALANEDVTLAVVTPDGQVFCDDDGAGGTNARLAGQFPAGTYAVYVGTYRAGRTTAYSLQMSEYQPQTQGPVATAYVQQPVVQQAPPPPDCRQAVLQAGHPGSSLVFCPGAEPYCAAALVGAGHHPSSLVFCQGVQPQCAVTLLQQGRHPSELVNCR